MAQMRERRPGRGGAAVHSLVDDSWQHSQAATETPAADVVAVWLVRRFAVSPLGEVLAAPRGGRSMTARPAYMPNRIHLHGVWRGMLLVRRWRQRCAELARGPEGVGLGELSQLNRTGF